MLVNLKEILLIAEEKNHAIAAFNVPTFENLVAAIKVSEKYNVPIIIQHAQVHEQVMPLEFIGPAMVALARNSKTPICVHLDHGEDIEYIEKALKFGFTSVMYDGSSLSIEDNIKNTNIVCEIANKYNAGVEAEVGIMGGEEGEKVIDNYFAESFYTDPNQAEEFINRTEITALASSFGTVHGFYANEPNLDYDRLKEIASRTKIPIVMHGGSGLRENEYKKVIELGVRKINYYSYSAKIGLEAATETIQSKSPELYHEVMEQVIDAIELDYEKVVNIFYSI